MPSCTLKKRVVIQRGKSFWKNLFYAINNLTITGINFHRRAMKIDTTFLLVRFNIFLRNKHKTSKFVFLIRRFILLNTKGIWKYLIHIFCSKWNETEPSYLHEYSIF